jgi:multiple sugar transport system substrate-binding protein
MAGFPAFQQSYEFLAQQFQEQHPTISVQYVSLDEQTSGLNLREQVELADVILINGRPPPDAAALLLDLTPLVSATGQFDANDYWPDLLEACQASGVQIGVPLSANVDLIFYDKSAFDAAGLLYPAPGWDWPTFQQTAQALTNQGDAEATRYGFVDNGRPLSLLGPLVDSLLAVNKTDLDSDRLAAEVGWYVDFVQAGVIPTPADDPQTAVANRDSVIRSRQAAMWLGNQFELDQWQSIYGENLGIVTFPAYQVATSNPARPTCAAISAGSAQAQAAWDWLHFLSQQPPAGVRSEAPARPSVAQSSAYWTNMDAEAATALHHALERGWYGSNAVQEAIAVNEALLQALAHESSLADKLPATLDRQPTLTSPTPDSTPIAVATPRISPTPAALPGSSITTDDVIIVDYYDSTGQSSRATLESLARAFNGAQDSITVRTNTAFGGSYITDVADNYDCFAWGGWASSYAASFPEFTTKFYSLTALLAAEDASFFDDFHMEHLTWNQVEGELYALPVAVQPYVIQYNADLLASLDIAPPTSDWSLEEFWALATAVTRSASDRNIYGFVPAILMPENLPLLAPGAAYPHDPYSSPPTASFIEPAVIQGMIWLAGMVEENVMFPVDWGGSRTTAENPSYSSLQMQQQSSLIALGEAAMWVAPAGQGDYHFNTGAVPFPQTQLLPRPSLTHALTSLYISRRTSNPSGCWEWLKFLSAQPNIFPGIPARQSVVESPGWTATVGAETAAAYRIAVTLPIQPLPDLNDPYFGAAYPYSIWWADALHEVFAGGSPADVLAEMQLRADVYLSCMTTAISVNPEQITACAREADPEFQSP